MESIKEIALRIAAETDILADESVRFAEALIAEVQKQNEPVAIVGELTSSSRAEAISKGHPIGRYLYAFPPNTEQIEQRVAEACALQVATETKFHWLDAARVAKEIRSGEWRKFMKGE